MKKEKQKLEKECIDLWKRCCLKMWGENCIFCGSKDQTTFHHYIPRSRSTLLKYDPMNGVPMCNMREHAKIHHFGTPDEVRELCQRIRDIRGKKWCNYIDKAKQEDNRSINTITWLTKQKQKLLDYLEGNEL